MASHEIDTLTGQIAYRLLRIGDVGGQPSILMPFSRGPAPRTSSKTLTFDHHLRQFGVEKRIAVDCRFHEIPFDSYVRRLGIMRFVCFGYYDEEAFTAMPEIEQQRFMDECLAYDDVIRKNGQSIVDGAGLQTFRNTKTLRFRNGKVLITDGPYVESKEQIGGFFFLEANDMDEAVRVVSKHPGLKAGPFEIRPVEDMTEVVRESERRRSKTT
jgi:hypothetical protein